jgi:ubiquinone biosynthesis monooxygenase Coq7
MTDTPIAPQKIARRPRPAAPGAKADDDLAAMIRVDHAGEYGAVRIYEGQLAVLAARGSAAVETIRHMAAQEQRHLKTFDALVNARRVRPTALEPVWRVAGFALGAATALMGEKAAMACTAAVEEVIDEHYASQVAQLEGRDEELKRTVEDFRADEIAHRNEALAHGAEEAPGYKLLSETIKVGCRLAIRLSERL